MLRPSPSDETRRKLIDRKGHVRDREILVEKRLQFPPQAAQFENPTSRIGGDLPLAKLANRPSVLRGHPCDPIRGSGYAIAAARRLTYFAVVASPKKPSAMRRQRLKHRPRGAQIPCLEPFCEPIVNRRKNLSRVALPILADPQAGHPAIPRTGQPVPGRP